MFLLDTNTISELRRAATQRVDPNVVAGRLKGAWRSFTFPQSRSTNLRSAHFARKTKTLVRERSSGAGLPSTYLGTSETAFFLSTCPLPFGRLSYRLTGRGKFPMRSSRRPRTSMVSVWSRAMFVTSRTRLSMSSTRGLRLRSFSSTKAVRRVVIH